MISKPNICSESLHRVVASDLGWQLRKRMSGFASKANVSNIRLKCCSANVRTLDPADLKKANEAGRRVSGKMQILDRAFHEHVVSIVGVQETRIQGNCRLCTEHYNIISSGANPEGTQGVQIWISTDVAASLLSEMPVSPRLLVSVVVICRQVFVLVVGHVRSEERR